MHTQHRWEKLGHFYLLVHLKREVCQLISSNQTSIFYYLQLHFIGKQLKKNEEKV